MGPISTPKVVEKGSILKPLAPPKDPKEPLWQSKGARRSHSEGLGRLKWSPKAHFDGFWVPRCPKKLHFYYTDASNWPQGFNFEGFGLDFAYSIVFFFGFYSFRFFWYWDVIAAATQHKHQEQIQTPPAEANISSNTNVTSSSQHHLQNQHHQQKQVSPAIVIIANTTIRTRHDKQQRQCRPKLAEQAVPADASISSRASVTSRNLCRTSIKTQSSHH